MYTFRFSSYSCEFRNHSNGTVAVLSHPDDSNKIKLGVISSDEVYLLKDFQWANVNDMNDASDETSKKYSGPEGLCEYIFDYYLGDIALTEKSTQQLAGLITKMLDGSSIEIESGEYYTLENDEIVSHNNE